MRLLAVPLKPEVPPAPPREPLRVVVEVVVRREEK